MYIYIYIGMGADLVPNIDQTTSNEWWIWLCPRMEGAPKNCSWTRSRGNMTIKHQTQWIRPIFGFNKEKHISKKRFQDPQWSFRSKQFPQLGPYITIPISRHVSFCAIAFAAGFGLVGTGGLGRLKFSVSVPMTTETTRELLKFTRICKRLGRVVKLGRCPNQMN